MPTYTFSFPASASGKLLTILDSEGATVDTIAAGGTSGALSTVAASGSLGPVVVTSTLDAGTYTATAVDARLFYSATAPGTLDVPSSLNVIEATAAEFSSTVQHRDYSTIVFAGDSNTANGGGPGVHISYRPGSFLSWALVMLGHRLTCLRNAGIGGDTSTQLLARFQADVLDYAPAWVHILIGTNDAGASTVVVPLVTTKANILSMIGQCRTIGARVIVGTIPPRNDRTGAAATHALSLNAWIRQLPMTEPDVIVVDYHAVLSDPASADDWLANYAADDGIHFRGKGGSVAGKLLADTLRPLVPDVPQVGRTTTDPINLLAAQCQWAGAGAGVAPSGWTASNAAYISLQARTDGIPGNWLVVTVPASGTFTLQRNGDPAIAVGESGWFAVEFQAESLQSLPVTQYLSADFNVPSGILISAMSHVSGGSGDPIHGDLAKTGVLKTPVYTRLVADTTIRPLITVAGGGTYRFACPSVFKV